MSKKKEEDKPVLEPMEGMDAVVNELAGLSIVGSILEDVIFKKTQDKVTDLIIRPKLKAYTAIAVVQAVKLQLDMYYIHHEVSNDVVQRRGVDPGHIWDDTDEALPPALDVHCEEIVKRVVKQHESISTIDKESRPTSMNSKRSKKKRTQKSSDGGSPQLAPLSPGYAGQRLGLGGKWKAKVAAGINVLIQTTGLNIMKDEFLRSPSIDRPRAVALSMSKRLLQKAISNHVEEEKLEESIDFMRVQKEREEMRLEMEAQERLHRQRIRQGDAQSEANKNHEEVQRFMGKIKTVDKKKPTGKDEDFLHKVNSTVRGEGITFADNGLPLLYQNTQQFAQMSKKINFDFSDLPPSSAQRKSRTDRLKRVIQELDENNTIEGHPSVAKKQNDENSEVNFQDCIKPIESISMQPGVLMSEDGRQIGGKEIAREGKLNIREYKKMLNPRQAQVQQAQQRISQSRLSTENESNDPLNKGYRRHLAKEKHLVDHSVKKGEYHLNPKLRPSSSRETNSFIRLENVSRINDSLESRRPQTKKSKYNRSISTQGSYMARVKEGDNKASVRDFQLEAKRELQVHTALSQQRKRLSSLHNDYTSNRETQKSVLERDEISAMQWPPAVENVDDYSSFVAKGHLIDTSGSQTITSTIPVHPRSRALPKRLKLDQSSELPAFNSASKINKSQQQISARTNSAQGNYTGRVLSQQQQMAFATQQNSVTNSSTHGRIQVYRNEEERKNVMQEFTSKQQNYQRLLVRPGLNGEKKDAGEARPHVRAVKAQSQLQQYNGDYKVVHASGAKKPGSPQRIRQRMTLLK